jgi:hypothetical protein
VTPGSRLVLGAALVLALLCAPVATGTPRTLVTNSVRYEDQRGEDPQGPDITTVRVSNNDAGAISIRIDIPTHPTLTEDMRLRVWFADGDPATGLSEGGDDAFILVDAYLLGLGKAALYTCRGSVCSPVWRDRPVAASLGFSYASGARFTFDAADLNIVTALGSSTRLDFSVAALSDVVYDPATGFDISRAHFEFAPGPTDRWTYFVRLGPSRLVVKHFAVGPSSAKAGQAFVAMLSATRNDTGAAVTTGEVECTAKVAGRTLRPRFRGFAAKSAVCRYALPSTAHGATIRGSIALTFAGKTVKRTFLRRIR